MTLKLTKKEIQEIIYGNLEDRFKVTFDDIPLYMPGHKCEPGETHRNYIEDDGREYRVLCFKDLKTGKEYDLNYTFNPEYENDFESNDEITFVVNKEDSDLFVKQEPVLKKEPPKSAEEIAYETLWNEYNSLEAQGVLVIVKPKERLKVPKAVIDDLKTFMKTQRFNAYQLSHKFVPVCIEYKLEQKSFWHWFQVKIGNWKA